MTWPMNAAVRPRPHLAGEGPLGEVAADLDFGVEVALADDAAFALGDVGGPQGTSRWRRARARSWTRRRPRDH
jgi:hypothetical protein